MHIARTHFSIPPWTIHICQKRLCDLTASILSSFWLFYIWWMFVWVFIQEKKYWWCCLRILIEHFWLLDVGFIILRLNFIIYFSIETDFRWNVPFLGLADQSHFLFACRTCTMAYLSPNPFKSPTWLQSLISCPLIDLWWYAFK